MHSRGGRRRITPRTSRKPELNRLQRLDENPDNDEAAHDARACVPCGRPNGRVQLVLQFTACLVLSNVVLRLAFLTPITTWLVTENNKGPLSSSIAASRNQQRLERRHQRQEHVRQRQQNSNVIANVGGAANEEEKNGKAGPSSLREHPNQDLMNPHDSHPPDPIALFSKPTASSLLYISETALQRRHECIAAIRRRHDELLGPFLNPATVRRRRNEDEENQRQREERHKVLLVDPAYHKNVGDHMITLGEIAFLQRMGYRASSKRPEDTVAGMVYDECTYIQGGPFLPLCDDFLKQQQQKQHHENKSGSLLQVALWHGGGNWGDLWPKVQSMRASSLDPLFTARYNPIISMPQSLYFDDEQVFQQENTNVMRQAVRMENPQASSTTSSEQVGLNLSLGQHAECRLILTWREQKSYDMAVKLYPFATHLIVPDIAFQLGPYAPILENSLGGNNETMAQKQQRQQPQLDILLLLRDDHESLYLHQRHRQAIRQILSSMTVKRSDGAVVTAGNRLGFTIVDWSDRLDRFESSSSGKKDIFFTNTSIQLLSLGRVLVCDRLHAAILAYLMGVPFVFVDQSTGKIHRTLHAAFTSASLARNSNHNDTAAHHHRPCHDATAAMWAQADNLTHALETAIGFLGTSGN